jgi:Leucine-rich repeat (LRR) protein
LIPEAMGQLSNLEELYLSNNEISFIPETTRGLPKLTKLSLQGMRYPKSFFTRD